MFGRVAMAQTMRDVAPDLMDILGTASVLPIRCRRRGRRRSERSTCTGSRRWCGIYGGTLEVFRNMIAQYVLGLGRPVYAPVKS